MSYSEEFTQQWEMTRKCMVGGIAKQFESQKQLNFSEVEQSFSREKKRWESPSQVNYSWLESLESEYPEIAEKFRQKLQELTLKSASPLPESSNTKIIIAAVAACVVCIFCYKECNVSYLYSLPVAAVVVAGMWVKSSATNNTNFIDACSKVRIFYEDQLKTMGDSLQAILQDK